VGHRRGAQRDADHADDDRPDREVLIAARVLPQHPFGEQQQHDQPHRERRLDDHQRRQRQRQHLQRPAQHRQPRAQQPAGPAQQAEQQGRAQVLLPRGLLRVGRLEGDP